MANTSADFFILGCANGFASRIIHSIEELGWADAFFSTFDISVIVWISCIAGVTLVLRDRTIGVHAFEIALGAGFVFLIILPLAPLSWIAVTGLSLYILFSTDVADFSTGCSHPVSGDGAHVLELYTVPVFRQLDLGGGCDAC